MIYSFKKSLEERLENRKAWLNFYSHYLKHMFISEATKKEYYRDKVKLKMLLTIYYLPINIFKFFSKITMIHKYEKTEKEIEVLQKAIENESKNFL